MIVTAAGAPAAPAREEDATVTLSDVTGGGTTTAPAAATTFLLSPAHCGGRRATMLLRDAAAFPLAVRLRDPGASIGEVFAFLSGLYFRGKLAYSAAFQAPAAGAPGALVIVPGLGLVPPDTIVTAAGLREVAAIGVAADEPRYAAPLARDARALAATLPGDARVVLLGSIATGKYVDVLEGVLDGRLRFPAAFVGRGDMSRGGLMLRCVHDGRELDYVALAGTVRRGPRPPKLPRLARSSRAADAP